MNEAMDDLTFHEIKSINDPQYDDWLDLYQKSFPLSEQVLVSSLNQMLRATETGENDTAHLLVTTNRAGDTVAMGLYENNIECQAATLWYLAVMPNNRGQGIGSRVYREIRRRALAGTEMRGLFFEVEDPDACHGDEMQTLANRRIAFYRRLGVQLLGGITYMQSVGWQPPLPMHIMVDLKETQPSSDVLSTARCLFGNGLLVVGPATLS